jgi:hypothetical protein
MIESARGLGGPGRAHFFGEGDSYITSEAAVVDTTGGLLHPHTEHLWHQYLIYHMYHSIALQHIFNAHVCFVAFSIHHP